MDGKSWEWEKVVSRARHAMDAVRDEWAKHEWAHGIVEDRREGSSVIYRLLTPCVASFLCCTAQVVEESR